MVSLIVAARPRFCRASSTIRQDFYGAARGGMETCDKSQGGCDLPPQTPLPHCTPPQRAQSLVVACAAERNRKPA